MANRKAVKQIVCLANSRKLLGRCIAGREWHGDRAGDWLRPVGDREHGEVSEYERQYEDGSDPKVLDIVQVPLLRHQPAGFQMENWLLDPEWYWVKKGRFQASELGRLTDPVGPLWFDGDSTYQGRNDRVREGQLESLDSSLRFIFVERLDLEVFAPDEAFGNSKRRVQGRFVHAGRDYWLWVTDPVYERRYLGKLNGSYELGPCHLTINLGERYARACYKFIVAIIEPDGGR